MATKLFLHDAVFDNPISFLPGLDKRALDDVQGALGTSRDNTTTASGNHILVTPASTFYWSYIVNPVTITGTITVNLWGLEDVMTTNAQLAVVISRYDAASNFISDVVAQGNAAHAKGVELGTASAAQNWTITPTSTTFSRGDVLVLVVHFDAIGTMAAGNGRLTYDAATGTSGDSYISFTETILPYSIVPTSRFVRQAFGIRLLVAETQRVARADFRVPLLETVLVQELADPRLSRDIKMMAALRADAQLLLHLFAENGGFAAVAANPQPFGYASLPSLHVFHPRFQVWFFDRTHPLFPPLAAAPGTSAV